MTLIGRLLCPGSGIVGHTPGIIYRTHWYIGHLLLGKFLCVVDIFVLFLVLLSLYLVSSIFWWFLPTPKLYSRRKQSCSTHSQWLNADQTLKLVIPKMERRFRIIFIQVIILIFYFSLKRKGRAERPGLVLRTISLERVVLIAAQENGYDIYSPCPIGCNI